MFAIVKLVPAVRAEIVNPPTSVATVELHVTPSLVPSVSSVVTNIWLLAVIAVVFTTTELDTALVGRATLPAAAAAQTAGDAELEQFVAVPMVGISTGTVNVALEAFKSNCAAWFVVAFSDMLPLAKRAKPLDAPFMYPRTSAFISVALSPKLTKPSPVAAVVKISMPPQLEPPSHNMTKLGFCPNVGMTPGWAQVLRIKPLNGGTEGGTEPMLVGSLIFTALPVSVIDDCAPVVVVPVALPITFTA